MPLAAPQLKRNAENKTTPSLVNLVVMVRATLAPLDW
jgi:hypothetical protein